MKRALTVFGFLAVLSPSPLWGEEPKSPSEELSAIAAAYEESQKEFQTAFQSAKSDEERQAIWKSLGAKASEVFWAGRALEVMRKHPKDPAILIGMRWLLWKARYCMETREAASLIAREQIDSEALAPLLRDYAVHLGYYECDEVDGLSAAAAEKSPHRDVRGYARFCMARCLKRYADRLARETPETQAECRHRAEQPYEEVLDKYADLPLTQDVTLGKAAEPELFELRHLSLGMEAPEIEGEDLDGKAIKLSDFRGKVTLLAFWFTRCGPCLADVPEEQALLKRMQGRPFAIVGVDGDEDKDAARKVAAGKGMGWRSFWDKKDLKGPIASRWNVQAWPTLYLIDAKGVIRSKGVDLRASSVRVGKDGKTEQYSLRDEAVEALVKETEEEQKHHGAAPP